MIVVVVRNSLCADTLLADLHHYFQKVPDPRKLSSTTSITFCPELIQNTDGEAKNDCERNTSRRFIKLFKREHSHLKVIILGDGIASNAPYIRLLQAYNMKFLLGAKPGNHQSLFATVEVSEETQYHEVSDKGFLYQP